MTFQIARAREPHILGWKGWLVLILLPTISASLPVIPRGACQDSQTSLGRVHHVQASLYHESLPETHSLVFHDGRHLAYIGIVLWAQ